jgi:ketosteroid isomerase-like protein
MTREQAQRYAEQWAADWNRRDLDAVLRHFEDDVVWSSPKAVQAVGVPTVRGKEALRRYLLAATERAQSLCFTVRRIIWDPETSELSIVYDREINGLHDRASEILRFGKSGRVASGEVHYGVVPLVE